MNIKIIVCYHKESVVYNNDVYMPMHLGKALSTKDLGIMGDDTGDNISELNPYFNETTGIYWAWKNLKDCDYVGLCHYRRYFLFDERKDNFQFEYITNDEEFSTLSFNSQRLEELLCDCDVVLTRKVRYATSINKLYNKLHGVETMKALRDAVNALYPDYITSYDRLMKSNRTPRCNMFIAKKSVFDDFCSWYFAILFKLYNDTNKLKFDLDKPRKIAFLSEILMPVYYLQNEKNLKIKYLPIAVINPERKRISNLRYIMSGIKSQMKYYLED